MCMVEGWVCVCVCVLGGGWVEVDGRKRKKEEVSVARPLGEGFFVSGERGMGVYHTCPGVCVSLCSPELT